MGNGESDLKYQIFCGTYQLPEGTAYRSYGICWHGGRIDDLSTVREDVQAFAAALNASGVDPCQVPGLVDDFLAGGLAESRV